MNATELAHWRYRVKAIAADVESCKRSLNARDPYLAFPGPDLFEEVRQELSLNKWLLEEARYMCELGELTLT